MKVINFATLCSSLFFIFCSADVNIEPIENKNEIINQLKTIAVENLRNWEPPFYEDNFLNPFSQSDDLLIVIDEFVIKNYDNWKNVVFDSMNEDRNQQFKMYKHNIDEVNVAVLSNSSGVVTTFYTWDYITKDDLHFNVKAKATLVFRKKEENWEIVHFVVSHQKEVQIE
ncbi:MAG: hypothetical protein HN729_09555 [Candidatus Marinimicrobia bacterium]|jgi:hypothetical protein|nr:hypothetical protein [Candidatus Neomarinimicrobiota bacterium]MBT3760936.1 hypothetical protein [Candidatus Neomarinimicrobiota bacterium]MBT4173999.1 hypothetical protein [Candidatus Neomarinimicrobiota bacterium]MBT4853062.1 hypothetical protein [Candidatus Neomarinimicrobiota bacterium]MBT5212852.1 hypothetical protein [Candidatus Neomarinimicrobiota bacterium]